MAAKLGSYLAPTARAVVLLREEVPTRAVLREELLKEQVFFHGATIYRNQVSI